MNTLNRIILSLLLTSISFVAGAYDATYYASSSKLNTGKWIKIKVTETGMQQISHEQLQQWGFDNPDDISVFGYGGNMLTSEFLSSYADDLPAQPVYRTDDKIIFYGESDARIFNYETVVSTYIQRNTCATGGYYLITDAYPGASDILEKKGTPSTSANTHTYHCNTQFVEKEVFSPAKAGVRYYGTDFKDEANQTIDFNAPYPYEPGSSTYRGRLNFRWIGRLAERQKLNYTANDYETSTYQNTALAIPGTNEYYKSADGYVSVVTHTDGSTSYSTTFSEPTVTYDYAALDYVSFAYYRRNNLYGISQLPMVFNSISSGDNAKFEYSNADMQFWNVCNPTAPFAYNTTYNSSTRATTIAFESSYSYKVNGHAYIIAFDPAQDLYSVEYAGNVANQNLHGTSTPQMLIITSDAFMSYAEELAQAHRDIQGMDVLVVNQESIYNEFSSGTPSVMGYRRLIKMFYDRDPERFKYVLLYGSGTFDNRHLAYGNSDYLLTYQCENAAHISYSTKAYAADSYFGMLSDSFTVSKIATAEMHVSVGRLPVITTANAVDVNKKLIAYLKNPPLDNSRNRATLIADAGDTSDPNAHQIQVEEIASTINALSPKTTITKAYCDLYPWESNISKDTKSILTRALNSGQAFVGFAGHGNSIGISGTQVYYKSDVIANQYDIKPFVYLSTCNAMSFDQNGNGFGEEFILVPDGGAIGIVASCRTVYQSHNQNLYLAFTNEFFSATPGETHGDIYRDTRNNLIATSSSDACLNALNYNFMGDPAMPMYIPSYAVSTTAISGTQIDDDTTTATVYPLADNNISGYITDSDGNILSDFNGTIYISVYEAPTTVQTLGQVSGNSPMDVVLDENCINQVIAKVTNGQFSASLDIPESTQPGNTSRIVYYAVSDDLTDQASSCFNNLIIAEYDETKAIIDTEAPVIAQMYLDSPEFTDGAVVNASTTLHVEIEADASGLCITDNKLETSTRLILDNNQSFSSAYGTLNFNPDGSYSFVFPLEGLSDGHHSVTIVLCDNAGNRTERTIYFTVINRDAQVALIIDESPARTEATFTLDHNFKSEPTGRLIVEDAAGNTIFSKADTRFPYTWDLNDVDGNPVADGNYDCYVIVNGEKQYGSSTKAKLIIVKQ